jgi:dTDP-4-dehydrorhamnose 3,5-epimerase
MQFQSLALADVKLITLKVFQDARGSFMENFRLDLFQAQCGPYPLVQDNYSVSDAGVLRGLHFQWRRPQGKLLQVTRGRIFDVLVDLRPASPTFGRWEGIWLDSRQPQLLWVPPGFAHGFYVAEGLADVSYKCTDYYQPDDQYVLAFDDPQLQIHWPLSGPLLMSDKDQQGQQWSELLPLLQAG